MFLIIICLVHDIGKSFTFQIGAEIQVHVEFCVCLFLFAILIYRLCLIGKSSSSFCVYSDTMHFFDFLFQGLIYHLMLLHHT